MRCDGDRVRETETETDTDTDTDTGTGDDVAGGSRDDRGAATVVAVGLVGAIVLVASLVVPLLGAFITSQRAANAADAAALAAADASAGIVAGVPCELAAELAARNGASLTACALDGPVAEVSVNASVLGLVISARARAGPPGWVG